MTLVLTKNCVEEEVYRLHAFFVGWLGGTLGNQPEELNLSFTERLEADFRIIEPDGQVRSRADLVATLQQAHGANPEFRIEISGVEVAACGSVWLATYRELQHGAKASKTPTNARLATAILTERQGQLRWRHVQETQLPSPEG